MNEASEGAQSIAALQSEVDRLRREVAARPGESSSDLQRRIDLLSKELSNLQGSNEKLAGTLKEAREHILNLKADLERLAQPPAGFGVVQSIPEGEEYLDIFTNGRKMRVQVSPDVDRSDLRVGQEVMLNESLSVIAAFGFEETGELVTLKEMLSEHRALVTARSDEDRVVRVARSLEGVSLRPGDALLMESRSGFVFEKIPRAEVEELVLEEVPDIDYEDIGGLGRQIEQIRDAVELPYLHAELFREYQLRPPKGILLYGPPGCGKTLIAKAVANSLAKKVAELTGKPEGRSYFLNIKGPELLNKYVGETERHIRLVFQRAREKANEGTPVIVFFDEMDSLFRTRGTGVSSDVENTIVPQLLAEIDGVESLQNVIVIGASNREDMIDPAILRPGRLDVKIKIERPDAQGATEIFAKYITTKIPLNADDLAENDMDRTKTVNAMIQSTVGRMYSEDDENRFLEVTYANGDKEVLYFKDFNSGAMIENIVGRAKKMAIKDQLDHGSYGIRVSHLLSACVDEFKENEDLPNTTNPDDWARISGKKGERIVYIRTLITGKSGSEPGRAIETLSNTGQYL
ncbi:MAG: proteasome ATPase [Actinomycetes bacterium]